VRLTSPIVLVVQGRPGGRTRAVLLASGCALVLLVTGCGGSDPAPPQRPKAAPQLSAELVQLRRDEVLQRVEVAVTNHAKVPVEIQTVDLRVPGYSGGGPQAKNEPLPPGEVVNLPTPYGEVTCPDSGDVEVGDPMVVVQVRRAADPTSYTVELTPTDPRDLVHGIATSTCLTKRLTSEVSFSFGPWRRSGSGDDTVLHGTLHARLKAGTPFDVTQLRGTVIFDLLPEDPSTSPLAHLTPASRRADIPVLLRQARCDGHARGEIKKPYAFLVWLGPPGGEQRAVNPPIADRDAAAFEAVCYLGWHA
jgi:hypothetical protein